MDVMCHIFYHDYNWKGLVTEITSFLLAKSNRLWSREKNLKSEDNRHEIC